MSARDGLTPEQRATLAEQLGDAQPARNSLLMSFGKSVQDRREHDHTTQREDWYCLNLAAYMGERMAPVLRRLLDAEARAERYRFAWRMAYQRAQGRGWAADRAGARAREGQEALQQMLFAVIASQIARKAAADEAADLRARATEPLIVSRYDTAIEPAPEEEPVFTVGAIAEDGRPVALLFDQETRAKVAGWLASADADRGAEVERLRRFASVTERCHDEIRARLAMVDIRDSAEAWDLGMAIIAILEGPPHPDATPGFFLPGHTYRRPFHGQFVYFRVSHVGTPPDSILPTAFGWLRTERGAATWSPRDENDLHGWTDITEDGDT